MPNTGFIAANKLVEIPAGVWMMATLAGATIGSREHP
jgi:hypothetical protein